MKKHIIITISEDHLDQINAIANLLDKEGLQVKHVFEFGVITGVVEDHHIESIKAYPEVFSLSEDLTQSIPPPDNDIQ